MKMTVLGSGGWIPTRSRQTSCYLITSGAEELVLDAGTERTAAAAQARFAAAVTAADGAVLKL